MNTKISVSTGKLPLSFWKTRTISLTALDKNLPLTLSLDSFGQQRFSALANAERFAREREARMIIARQFVLLTKMENPLSKFTLASSCQELHLVVPIPSTSAKEVNASKVAW